MASFSRARVSVKCNVDREGASPSSTHNPRHGAQPFDRSYAELLFREERIDEARPLILRANEVCRNTGPFE